MIPENREFVERTSSDGGNYDVMQKLQSYLRDKYTPEQVNNEQTVNLLAQVAKDWCLRHNQEMPEKGYTSIAQSAISRFINNWQDKQQGEDDRGHRFGKAVL